MTLANNNSTSDKQKGWLIFAGIVLVNFVLKALFAGSNQLGLDEPFTVFYSQQPLSEIFKMLGQENNPPLHFIFLHFWIKLFGISEISVRMPSVIFSSAAAGIIFLIGKRYISLISGLLAATLFTFSTFNIYIAHEARVYALFTMLSALSLYYYLRLMTEDRNKTTLTALIITNALVLYSHYLGALIILVQAFLFFIMPGQIRKNVLRPLITVSFFTVLLYVPNIYIFISRLSLYNVSSSWLNPPEFAGLYDNIMKYSNAPVVAVTFITLIVAAFIAFFVKRKNEKISPAARVLAAYFLVSYSAIFLISFRFPSFFDRYLSFIFPSFYLLIALSISYLFRRGALQWMLPAMLTLLMTASVNINRSNRNDTRVIAELIKSYPVNNRKVVIYPSWTEKGIVYYYNREYFKNWNSFNTSLQNDNIFAQDIPDEIMKIASQDTLTLIYIQTGTNKGTPEDSPYNRLKRHYSNCTDRDEFGGFYVSIFSGNKK
jgi:uncharacterized membrane protein